jgi:mycothiol synthase
VTLFGSIDLLEPGVEAPGWVLHATNPLDADNLDSALHQITAQGGGAVDLWIEEVERADDQLATDRGFEASRELWQLRCALPAVDPDLEVRRFEPEDAEEFLAVNNRAFSWHPEQGGMTLDDLASRQAESWYDPAGFLVHDVDGRMAGFCWTKVHEDTEPPMGEIYVIAVDPDFHGQGLGAPLTLAGLAHLSEAGLTIGMLYVESDNDAANTVYERIGFTRHHANRVYRRDVQPI